MNKQELDLLGQPPRERFDRDTQLSGDACTVGVGGDEALGVFDADDDVAERKRGLRILLIIEQREGQHIGGGVLLAPLQVERVDGRIVAEQDAYLGVIFQAQRPEMLLGLVAQQSA